MCLGVGGLPLAGDSQPAFAHAYCELLQHVRDCVCTCDAESVQYMYSVLYSG